MSNMNEEHNFAFIFPQNSVCIDILIRNENYTKSTTLIWVQFYVIIFEIFFLWTYYLLVFFSLQSKCESPGLKKTHLSKYIDFKKEEEKA